MASGASTQFVNTRSVFTIPGLRLATTAAHELHRSRFEKNRAFVGGAVFSDSSSAGFQGCEFISNGGAFSVTGQGGGDLHCSGGGAIAITGLLEPLSCSLLLIDRCGS